MPESLLPTKFVCTGISLTANRDVMPPGKYPFLRNVRAPRAGSITSRPGLAQVATTSTLVNDSIRRLNDDVAGDWTLIVGGITAIGTYNLYAGKTGALTNIDTGYSVNPITMVPFRPDQSVRPWMYIADSLRMRKVRVDGIVRKIGIPAPLAPPVVALAAPSYNDIDNFNSYADSPDLQVDWVEGGGAGNPTLANRVDVATATIGSILYDSGTTGWACISPSDAGDGIQSGMRLEIDTAGTPETVTVESIYPASGSTTIATIIYDSGTTGLCSIALTTPVIEIRQNSLVTIAGAENVRVLSVTGGPNGTASFRCFTTSARAAGDSIVAIAAFRAYTTANHTAGQTLKSTYASTALTFATDPVGTLTRFAGGAVTAATNASPIVITTDDNHGLKTGNRVKIVGVEGNTAANGSWTIIVLSDTTFSLTGSTGSGAWTAGGAVTLDLSQIVSGVRFSDQDYLHVSVLLADPELITEGRIELDITEFTDAASYDAIDFTENYYSYVFRPDDLTAAFGGGETLVAAKESALRNRLIDESGLPDLSQEEIDALNQQYADEYQEYLAYQIGGGVYRGYYGPNYNPYDPAGYIPPSGLTPEIRSAQAGIGSSQWFELKFRLSDMIRSGTDYTRTLKDVAKIRIKLTCTADTTVGVDAWWIGGGYGPDTPGVSAPYTYRYRGRASVTGAVSNFSPAVRTLSSPSRQAVWIGPPSHPDTAETDKLDIERFGGALLGWRYIATIPNYAPKTVTGATNATPIEITAGTHGLQTGDTVYISGITGNTAANGFWVITRTAATTFTLNTSVGNGVYGAGGTVQPAFLDQQSDSAVVSNPAPGNDHFQPWPVIGSPVSGLATTVAGTTLLETSGTAFNTSWAPGTIITVSGVNYTIYRVISSTRLETVENMGTGSVIAWNVYEPVIISTPLPFMWGPFEGRMFACGDIQNPGRLYFCNNNDPDSTRDTNYIDITSPSEPLQNGCMYNGRAYVFSTERMFAIYPTSDLNQFTAVEVPAGRGLDKPWALAVGPKIWFLGKDGIYETEGTGATNITDPDLYPLFPHEGSVGTATNGVWEPDLVNGAVTSFRLCYYEGMLYFDYQDSGGNNATLVYDTRFSGWFFDLYNPGTSAEISSRYGEEGGSRLLTVGSNLSPVGIVGQLSATTYTDLTASSFIVEAQTPSFDNGDPRSDKLYTDVAVDLDTDGIIVSVTPYFNTFQTPGPTVPITTPTRSNVVLDINSGNGASSPNIALYLTWSTATNSAVNLHSWTPTVTARPPATRLYSTDYSDAGSPHAKQFRAVLITADTGPATRQVQILYDQDIPGPVLTVSQNGGGRPVTVPYAFTPFKAHRVRLLPVDPNDWTLYGIDWTFDPYPDTAPIWTDWHDDGYPGPKFMQGVLLQVDTGGVSVGVEVQYLDEASSTYSVLTTLQVTTSGPQEQFFAFDTTPRAHLLRLVPDSPWELHKAVWLYTKHPENTHVIADWTNNGEPREKFLQGLVIHSDTGALDATLRVEYDGQFLTNLIVNSDGQQEQPFSFPDPPLAHLFRAYCTSGNIRIFNVTWIATVKSLQTALVPDWDLQGYGREKYVQGFVLRADTSNATVPMELQTDGGTVLQTFNAVHDGDLTLPYALTTPQLAYLIRLVPLTDYRFYSIEWIYAEKSVNAALVPDWTEQGYGKEKFVQGLVIRADTENEIVQVNVEVDGAVTQTLFVQHDGDQRKPYTITTPPLSYLVRLVPQSPWRVYDVEWLYVQKNIQAALVPDWTPEGYGQEKFLQGVIIRADTSNLSVPVEVQVDGQTVQTLTVTHNGDLQLPYAITTPPLAYLVRLVPQADWRLYDIQWIYTDKSVNAALVPDWNEQGYGKEKFVQGIIIRADTENEVVQVNVEVDGEVTQTLFVQHDGDERKPYTITNPPLSYMLRLVPQSAWRVYNVEWIYVQKNIQAALVPDWAEQGFGQEKFVQGVIIRADTENTVVPVEVQVDGVTVQTLSVQHNGDVRLPYAITTPPLSYLTRLVPQADWRVYDVEWLYVNKSVQAALVPDWGNVGFGREKLIQGLVVRADTEGDAVPIEVQVDGEVTQTLTALHDGDRQKAYALTTPVLAYLLRLVPQAAWRVYDVQWIYAEKNVNAAITTDWMDLGHKGSKFMQGVRIQADTEGFDVEVEVLYDGGQLGDTLTVNHNGERLEPYDFDTPFIARLLRLVPADPWRLYALEWVWEPAPDLAYTWETPTVTHTPAYSHLGWMYIAHIGTADISLTLTLDGVAQTPLTISHGSGSYVRSFVRLPVFKFKSIKYRLTSDQPFRLFKQDCTIAVRPWGSSDQYQILQPFGDISVVSGARL